MHSGSDDRKEWKQAVADNSVDTEPTIPDYLGHYSPDCHDVPGSSNGYIISTQAWKLSTRAFDQPCINGGTAATTTACFQSASDSTNGLDVTQVGERFTAGVLQNERAVKRLKSPHESQDLSKHQSQYESQFDKFVTVSKLLLDRRLIQLLENENRMKLSLYWKDHNCIKFREAMTFANQKPDGPNCDCICCSLSGRKDERNGKPVHGFDCTFMPYFQALLLECCITTKSSEGGDGIEHESTYDSIFDVSTHTYVYNIDTHLISMGGTGWYLFTYGAKLWKERSIESVELKNFSLLFQKLYDDGVEDESDSGDV